ncbi:MAG: glycoside hydrolase family 9 protein [Clostridia bacterium]|nr:glycoside hydrolase family 9 protein [Clostridia bacterium]
MGNFVNDFRMNHVGFPCHSKKSFVFYGESREEFTVMKMRNAVLEPVYTAKFVQTAGALCGDFTCVTEPGVYKIKSGNSYSRTIYIYDHIYDSVCRVLTNYFVWQRCGDDAGWNGKCHDHDRIIDKYGEEHSLVGGHHQSGDLRKWAFGSAEGVWGLSKFLELGNPRWNRGDIQYDIAHSAKYFLSRTSREGYVYDCTFVPEGYDQNACKGVGYADYGSFWEPFLYFDRPTDPQGHWNVIRLLASASVTLRESDADLAERCLTGAKKIWDWMMREGQFVSNFDWEIYPPIGHDGFKECLFRFYFPGSAFTLCGCAVSAMELYQAFPCQEYKDAAISAVNTLASYMIKDEQGALNYFRLSAEDSRPAESVGFFPFNLPMVFVEALDLWSDHPDAAEWLECVKAAVKKFSWMSRTNAFGKTTNHCTAGETPDKPRWNYGASSFVMDLGDTARFLTKASRYTDRTECLAIAQRLLDFVMGANPADSSCIEAVGYNQPCRAIFGEFFPAQPQIPGGMYTDIQPSEPDFARFGREYDMPVVGAFLYALALYQKTIAESGDC